jgi:hypothetical protein
MPVKGALQALARAASFTVAHFVALVRVAPMPLRGALLAAPFVPVLVHGPTGAEDGACGVLTATVVPALAFLWGLAWSRPSEPRLRVLRAAFLDAPRGAKGTVALVTTLAGALAFAASCAVLGSDKRFRPQYCVALSMTNRPSNAWSPSDITFRINFARSKDKRFHPMVWMISVSKNTNIQ